MKIRVKFCSQLECDEFPIITPGGFIMPRVSETFDRREEKNDTTWASVAQFVGEEKPEKSTNAISRDVFPSENTHPYIISKLRTECVEFYEKKGRVASMELTWIISRFCKASVSGCWSRSRLLYETRKVCRAVQLSRYSCSGFQPFLPTLFPSNLMQPVQVEYFGIRVKKSRSI